MKTANSIAAVMNKRALRHTMGNSKEVSGTVKEVKERSVEKISDQHISVNSFYGIIWGHLAACRISS